jgi:outer membrane protein OmpA-like peptidoglycan-associated protein
MRSLLSAIAIGLTMLLSGCAPMFIVGAGVGAGAFSYIAGNVTRVYEADYQQSIKASTNVMERLNFKRKEESDDESKTIIEGYLSHDTPVTIEVTYVDKAWTQIGVRTGYVGVDNLEKSEQVHGDIAEELKRSKPGIIKATSPKQKEKPSETKPRAFRTQYDTLPQAPATASTPDKSPTDDSRSFDRRQVDPALFSSDSKTTTFIYFPKSSLEIPSGSYNALEDIISYLDKNPTAKVDIRGYTDSTGSSSRNLALSEERAFRIRDYLIENGVSEERITAQGLGATNFLESNRSERLRKMNRRVEIKIK